MKLQTIINKELLSKCPYFLQDNIVSEIKIYTSVNSVVEFPGAGLGRLITINSELNGTI